MFEIGLCSYCRSGGGRGNPNYKYNNGVQTGPFKRPATVRSSDSHLRGSDKSSHWTGGVSAKQCDPVSK